VTADRLGTRGSTPTDPRATAFGFGQRRSWVFSVWWYPAVLAMAGAVHAGLATIIGQSPGIGIMMTILGGVFAALGWVFTTWPRFTRRLPKPASDIPGWNRESGLPQA